MTLNLHWDPPTPSDSDFILDFLATQTLKWYVQWLR